MKFEITIIGSDGDRVSTQEFETRYWYKAVDAFVAQLKMSGWTIPKEYIRVRDFEDVELDYSQNITQGFNNED